MLEIKMASSGLFKITACSKLGYDIHEDPSIYGWKPAISVANVGQLAIDLLIQSTGAVKVTNVWHEAFIPLIGAHPYKEDSTGLCTEFEVYELKQHKVLFLQFRSPLWKSKEDDLLNELMGFFEQLQASKVVILSSLYDYERSDRQIKEPRVRCCVCPLTQSLYESTFRPLNCICMEVKGEMEPSGIMVADMFLPGGGFTQSLHLKCYLIYQYQESYVTNVTELLNQSSTARKTEMSVQRPEYFDAAFIDKKVPCVSFLKFCSDGDNTPEALELASLVDGWLNVIPASADKSKTFVQPPSWKYIFGGPSPPELFP